MPLSVSGGALAAYYRNADIFACLSEHEGFGVPLIEAMHHSIPVVAYNAAAIGETLGDGGLLLDVKSPSVVAATWDRIMRDDTVRRQLIEAGKCRLSDFSLEKSSQRWRHVIEAFAAAFE